MKRDRKDQRDCVDADGLNGVVKRIHGVLREIFSDQHLRCTCSDMLLKSNNLMRSKRIGDAFRRGRLPFIELWQDTR